MTVDDADDWWFSLPEDRRIGLAWWLSERRAPAPMPMDGQLAIPPT